MPANKNFSVGSAALTVNYTGDFWPTLRAFWSDGAKLDFSGYSNMPVGALNLSGAGGVDRALTQWSGSANTPFKLLSAGGFKSDTYDTFQANIYFGASSGRAFWNYDAGAYLDYTQSASRWGLVLGGIYRLSVDPNRLLILQSRTNEPTAGQTVRNNGVSASVAGEVYSELQNELGVRVSNERTVLSVDGSTTKEIYLTPAGARTADRTALAAVFRSGSAIVDDGVSGLQVRSLRVAQPTHVFAKVSAQSFSVAANTIAGSVVALINGTVAAGSDVTVNTTLNRITFGVAMRVQITAQLAAEKTNAGIGNYELLVYQNGSGGNTLMSDAFGAASRSNASSSRTLAVAAGDYIDFRLYNSHPTNSLDLSIYSGTISLHRVA
jgi:hypothetical protein